MTRTIEIDVRFAGGRVRVKRATGSTDRRVARDMKAMLRWLWRQPAYRHLVEEIAAGAKALADVYAAYVTDQLAALAPHFEDRPLFDAREGWLATFDCSPSHRTRLRQAFTCLEALRRRRDARLSELPVLLLEYRAHCVPAGTPRAFNYARAGSQALLRDLIGRRHPLYLRVADLQPMREAKQGKKGLTVPEAGAARDALRQHSPAAARAWWAMCWTGMGPTEFWGGWTVETDRVVIRGTKRPGRRWGTEGRAVPLVALPTRPEIQPQQLARLLRPLGLAPRQARNTFARALEDAGIPRTRRKLYLGHGVKDITDGYERHEIAAFLAEDRARLCALLGTAGYALEAM